MTDINTWLDTNYLEEERKNLTDLYLKKNDLEGDLELTWEEFPKLERVWYIEELRIITNWDLTLAEILKQKTPKGVFLKVGNSVEILKYTPIDEVMKELYPEDEREKITKLDLTQKGLRGTLDLNGFNNLEELIVNMDCPWGRKYANSNYITGLNFDDATDSLRKLTLTNNPDGLGLKRLARLTNLEKLVIKGDSNYPAQWTSSLKEIEGLENLTKLDISYNPNIKLGLENIKNLEIVEVKGTVYEKSLKSFNGDVQAWKVIVFPKKVSEEKDEINDKIVEYLQESRKELQELNQWGLTDLDLESKIEILSKKWES